MRCIFFKKIVFTYLIALTFIIASTGFVTPPAAAGESNPAVTSPIVANSSTQLIRENQSVAELPVTSETSDLDLGPELSRSGSDIATQEASVKKLVKAVAPTPTPKPTPKPTPIPTPKVTPKPVAQTQTGRSVAPIKLSSSDLLLLEQVLQAEFGDSSYKTKMMGMTIILNRAERNNRSVRSILLASGQFSVVSNGSIYHVTIDANTRKAVTDSLAGRRVFSLKAYYFWDHGLSKSNGLWDNPIIAISEGTVFANG